MEDVKKHYIFVLAGLVSLALSGCSSVQRTQEPTGDNRSEVVTREETTHDGMSEEPLVASSDLYLGYPSARSNSVWMSRLIVTEPIPQGIQGRVLQANNLSDAESSRPSKSSNRVTKRTESRKVASQKSSSILTVIERGVKRNTQNTENCYSV